MWGYYYDLTMYGMWESRQEAGQAAVEAGHHGATPYAMSLVNDPRPPATPARRMSADAEFLALGR